MDNKLVRRFKKVRINLMRSGPFVKLGPLMMLGKTELVEEGIPTAATNGRDEIYNINFVMQFDDKEVAFIVCHETMHKAARHMVTYRQLAKIDHYRANAACDYWINITLYNADPTEKYIAMPKDPTSGKIIGLFDIKYDGWPVTKIFKDLKQKTKGRKSKGKNEEGETEDGGGGGGGFDEHDWDGASEMSKEDIDQLSEDVKQAIRQGQMAAKKAGQEAGGNGLELGELLTSRVDWRAQLQQFMNHNCRRKEVSSWRKPNRRFLHQDIILPSIVGNSMRELVLAVDASGSMHWGGRFEKVMGEVKKITTTMGIEKLHLLYWDGKVGTPHEVYTGTNVEKAVLNTSPVGGGGTDVQCVCDYMKENKMRPDAVIVLTDGELFGGWGTWTVPVMWAITGNPQTTAGVGKTMHIDD